VSFNATAELVRSFDLVEAAGGYARPIFVNVAFAGKCEFSDFVNAFECM
jgi:hypothetical protein